LMQRFPGWRVMAQYMVLSADTFNSTAMDSGDETAKATKAERALMFTLGYRPTTVDFEQQVEYMSWRLEQDLLDLYERKNSRTTRRIRRLGDKFTELEMPLVPPSSE